MTARLQTLIADRSAILEKAGVDQGLAEVELILCHLLDCTRLDLYLEGAERVDAELITRMDQIIARRVTRYPLQYILEEAWFYGRKFFVSPAVMVPTPETERLCEAAAAFCEHRGIDTPRILDLGVGSGVISVTVACELPEARITALDKSTDAIEVARRNAETHGVTDRIVFRESDYFSAAREGEAFDLILSNPPYITESDYQDVPPEVKEDPVISLVSGADGLDAIRVILRDAPGLLKPGGRIMFEVGYNQAARIAAMTENDDRFTEFRCIKDLNDWDRVIILACD